MAPLIQAISAGFSSLSRCENRGSKRPRDLNEVAEPCGTPSAPRHPDHHPPPLRCAHHAHSQSLYQDAATRPHLEYALPWTTTMLKLSPSARQVPKLTQRQQTTVTLLMLAVFRYKCDPIGPASSVRRIMLPRLSYR